MQLATTNAARKSRGLGAAFSALALAVLVAWVFAAATLWEVIRAGGPALHPVRRELMASVAASPGLKLDIVKFFAAHALIHACFGLMVWALALVACRAYPKLRASLLPLVLGCSVLALAFVYALNAAMFPWSIFAAAHTILSAALFGPVTLADAVILAVLSAIGWVLFRAALTFDLVRAQGLRIASYTIVGVGVVATVQAVGLAPSSVLNAKPHVIIIGVDSLRPDAVGYGREFGVTPNISAFLNNAVAFRDTVTPLARTFPSWVTILSGQHPTRTGARDNLMPRDALNTFETLADRMRAAGYATVYATDEVRFSNIDASFGFDQVIGPKMGASDFMLGRWGDQPLSNLLAHTRIAQALFPNLYGNRAAAAIYQPEVFVEWVDRQVEFDRPTLLAMHLTLPHHPFYWAEDASELFALTTDASYRYLAAAIGADRQFGQMLKALERRGVLENAIVVLLSDHGEALGLSSDNLLISREAKMAVGKTQVSMVGHGSSVLSPGQYQVVLALRRFGSAQSAASPSEGVVRSTPASLEDVAPTILSLTGIAYDERDFDGRSLKNEMGSANADSSLLARIRYTETGLTTTFMRMGDFGESANVAEGMKFFRVEPASSRVIFRRERIGDLLEQKERAAMSREWLLAVVPDPDAGRPKYVLVHRDGGTPRVVTHDPEQVADAEFAALWTSLRDRFGDELTASTKH